MISYAVEVFNFIIMLEDLAETSYILHVHPSIQHASTSLYMKHVHPLAIWD